VRTRAGPHAPRAWARRQQARVLCASCRPSACARLHADGAAWRRARLLSVDLAVDDHPGAAAQLRAGWQVHECWLPVAPQRVHNQRARLHRPGARAQRAGTPGALHAVVRLSTRTRPHAGVAACRTGNKLRHPCAPTPPSQRPCWWRSSVGVQRRAAARLQHALEQVALPAAEAAPVGEHEERQALAVKLLHSVRGLERAVREPDLPGLRGRGRRGRRRARATFLRARPASARAQPDLSPGCTTGPGRAAPAHLGQDAL